MQQSIFFWHYRQVYVIMLVHKKSGCIKEEASPLQRWGNERQQTQMDVTMRTVKHRRRSPRHIAQTQSLKIFRKGLDTDMNNLVWPGGWLFWTGICTSELPRLFQPELFYSPVTVHTVYKLVTSLGSHLEHNFGFLAKINPDLVCPGVLAQVSVCINKYTQHTLPISMVPEAKSYMGYCVPIYVMHVLKYRGFTFSYWKTTYKCLVILL